MLINFAALVSICAWVGVAAGHTVAHLSHRDAGAETVQRALLDLDPGGVGGPLEVLVAVDHVAQANLHPPSTPSRSEVVEVAVGRGWELVDADSGVSILRRGPIQADVWDDRVITWSPPRHLAAGALVGVVAGLAGAAALARRRIGVLGVLFGVAATPFAAVALSHALNAPTPPFGGVYGPNDMLVDLSLFILLTWGALLVAAHWLGVDVISAVRRAKERLDGVT